MMLQITTLLFDCDNTLVLSEELAFEACADLANEILEAKGLPDRCSSPSSLALTPFPTPSHPARTHH